MAFVICYCSSLPSPPMSYTFTSQSPTVQQIPCHGCGSATPTRIATAGRHIGNVVYNCKTCGGYGYPFLGIHGKSKFHEQPSQPQPQPSQPPSQPTFTPPMYPSGLQFTQQPQHAVLPTPCAKAIPDAIRALQREVEALKFIVSQNTASIYQMGQTLQAASFGGGTPTPFADSQAE